MKLLLLVLLLAPVLCSASVTGSVHVTGRLLCSKEPYKQEKVKVFEYNKIASDGFWGEETTDDSGYFSLKTSGYDWFSVDPYIWIPNYCGQQVAGTKQCTASCIRIEIPQDYITEGHVPKIKFDIGTLELLNFEFGEQRSLYRVIFGGSKECRQRP